MSSGATTCAAAAPSAYASVASEAQPAASRHTGQLAFIVHNAPAVHSTASAAPDAAGSAANTDSPVPAAMRFGRSDERHPEHRDDRQHTDQDAQLVERDARRAFRHLTKPFDFR
jgi:hypothetical protein